MEKKEIKEIDEEEFVRIRELCGINSDFIVTKVLDEGIKKYWYVPREKDKEFGEYLQSIAPRYTQKELDKAKIEVLTEIFQTCYQEDSKTRELVEEKLAKLKTKE